MIDFLKELEESFRGNGVDISGMPGEVTIEDGKLFISKHMALDFSEHDKMVAEEKDKKIAELEGVLNRLTMDLKNSMGQIYELQEENKMLKEEKDRLAEMINDLLEDDTSELEENLKNACGENQKLKITVDVLSKRIAELMEVHEF